jgi:beta-lactam-binding protein with PASTA domain
MKKFSNSFRFVHCYAIYYIFIPICMYEQPQNIFDRIFTRQRKIKLGLFIIIVLASFFVCNDILMPWIVQSGNTTTVPSVIGMPLESAQHLLDSLELTPMQTEARPSDVYPPGRVVIQTPNPGTTVKKGRRVYLAISGGEQLVSVPNLKGKTVRDAKFALERNNLTLGTISYTLNDSFPANTIIDQSVQPEAMMRRSARISVVVSQGARVDRVAVPEVIGKPLTEAGRILANHGLKIGTVNYQPSTGLLPNTVLDQFPRPGEFIEHGQKVDLFVTRTETKPPTEN